MRSNEDMGPRYGARGVVRSDGWHQDRLMLRVDPSGAVKGCAQEDIIPILSRRRSNAGIAKAHLVAGADWRMPSPPPAYRRSGVWSAGSSR